MVGLRSTTIGLSKNRDFGSLAMIAGLV